MNPSVLSSITQKENVIGNIADFSDAEVVSSAVKVGDQQMMESPDKKEQYTSSMVPRSRQKKK